MQFPQLWLPRLLANPFLAARSLRSRDKSGILTLREAALQHPPTVLIVDDDPSHLKLYGWVLERGGFHTITALVQGGAVELPQQQSIDAAVLDYRLGPTLSAVDLAKRLRIDSPSMPIVVLSDLPWMPEDVAPYASGFVRKGEPQQLIEMIGSVIGESTDGAGSGARAL